MKKFEISVVIVSYNNQAIVFPCLESLRHTTGLKVYVVDNSSNKTFLAKLRKEFPEIELIHNDENVGFSKANNQALRKVKTPYTLVLNSDTTVPAETIPAMIEFMDQNLDVGMAGCRVELVDGTLDKACRRSFPTPWVAFTKYSYLGKVFPKSKLFGRYNLSYLPEDETYEVESLVGAFMMIRTKAMTEVGLFDEDYFMYGEDIDWCYRFWQKGWKIMYHPVVKIIHHKGASSGIKKHSTKLSKQSLNARQKTLDAFYHSMRIFYNKHYIGKYPWVVTRTVLIGVGTKHRFARLKLQSEYKKSQII